jgi:ketosteroid isomerase-like protein
MIFLFAGANQDKMLSQEDEKAIRHMHDEFEKSFLNPGWATTMIEFYAKDSIQMPPNESIVSGREAIRARFDSFEGNLSWEYRERPIKIIEGRDDLAFTWSIYKGKGKHNGKSFNNGAVMLTVFRKQKDGTWKIVCDIWSYDK